MEVMQTFIQDIISNDANPSGVTPGPNRRTKLCRRRVIFHIDSDVFLPNTANTFFLFIYVVYVGSKQSCTLLKYPRIPFFLRR